MTEELAAGDEATPLLTDFDVVALDTDWMSPGLIYAFLVPHATGYALIETGPQRTAETLWRKLAEHVTPDRPLTDIVVTHIHLDHSGAAGWLQARTGATVHVHERGLKHLLDPSRIVAGSRKVFGQAFDMLWKEPLPATGKVVSLADGDTVRLPDRGLVIVDTPGHAWHHATIFDVESRTAFTGDVAGVRYAGPRSVRLPSVPSDFDEASWRTSLDKLTRLGAARLALTHGGIVGEVAPHLEEAVAVLDETMHCFEGIGENDVAAVEAKVRALWAERIADEPQRDSLAGKYEMIMATPLCVRGIAMARERPRRD